MDLAAAVQKLKETYPCRDSQFAKLSSLLGHPSFSSPSAICLTGFPATGKSTVTRSFLDAINAEYVWVDCGEAFSSALLFDRIVNKFRQIGERDLPRLKMTMDINSLVVEVHKALEGIQGKVVLVSPSTRSKLMKRSLIKHTISHSFNPTH
jgi:Cdc6-like AAA superfamily ATPase